MGNVFDELRGDYAAKLTAAGLAAVTLSPLASPPFVLVGPITLNRPEGIGAWGGDLPVVIAVPPPGDDIALAALGDRLELVIRTLGFATALPGTYEVGDRTPLPAYTLTYPVSVPNPDC